MILLEIKEFFMKKFKLLMSVLIVAGAVATQASTRTVTTTASSGAGSLADAIAALNNGDTIAFNIGGTGPHYITPPTGGFGIITQNNITIDGYTEPGSSVNTSTILAANNANIQIVIKGSDNGTTSTFTDLTALGITGFTDGEEALLAGIGATNFTVRGICFLGDWVDGVAAESEYAIALGGNAVAANPHISGCRFGLDPDNTTVGRLKDGIAYFGGVDGLVVGVAAGPSDAAAARAQFNIFVGMYISVIGDAGPVRISGNFFNVYPDGLHDYNVNSDDGAVDHSMEAIMELGSNNKAIIGTDGDGLNDAEERNIFGGATLAGDNRILEWYGNSPTNTLIAGNYIGVGIDGVTRFTNGGPVMEVIESSKSLDNVQIGSDFDGISDDIEGNIISWNYPFSTLYPDPLNPGFDKHWRFAKIDIGAVMSLRGNKMIGNDPTPRTYAPEGLANDADRLEQYSNYVAAFMLPPGDYHTFFPTLATKSSSKQLVGTCAPGNAPYTNVIMDVYVADPEGWTNGMKFQLPELANGPSFNGFPQGKIYKGSVSLGNSFAGGSFSLDVSALGLAPTDFVTVSANYSADVPGTHRGRTHTSNFANPVNVLAPITITSIVNNAGTLTIQWTGGAAPYTLQKRSPITGAWGNVTTGIAGTSTTDTVTGTEAYYRIIN